MIGAAVGLIIVHDRQTLPNLWTHSMALHQWRPAIPPGSEHPGANGGVTLPQVSSSRSDRRVHVRRRWTVLGVVVLVFVIVVALVATGGHGPSASPPATTHPSTTAATLPPEPPFAVGTLSLTLSEPGAPDQAGDVPEKSSGPYPLVVFSEGYGFDPGTYAPLLDAWAMAGYVVVDPVYPFTAPTSPGGLVRSDIVNHPADLRFVITSMLGDSAAAGGTLAGMIDSSEVGIIGHSDGGDVSLAVANNSC